MNGTLRFRSRLSTKSVQCSGPTPFIEIAAEQSLLLPFDQFAFAELKSEGKQQHLRLVFATHEISIRGHPLRRIEAAMQRMELSFLAPLSGNQRSLISDGLPVVLKITAIEVESNERATVENKLRAVGSMIAFAPKTAK